MFGNTIGYGFNTLYRADRRATKFLDNKCHEKKKGRRKAAY
jgi:hypothetical protein